jgi:hypothetical protein
MQCEYWQHLKQERQFHPSTHLGECRRNPPVATSDTAGGWPFTTAGDWCGEFWPGGRIGAPLPLGAKAYEYKDETPTYSPRRKSTTF